MPLQERLIAPGAPEWHDILARADHDFYHLPCYSELTAPAGERPLAFVARQGEHRLLIPFLLRSIPEAIAGCEGDQDAGSPYGYAGPIATTGAPREFLDAGLRAFERRLAQERVVSGFFRLHTILNTPEQFEGVGRLVNHGPSVFIDLTHTEEELWAQTRRGHKRDLVVLEKKGYSIVMNDWDRLDDFLTCYYDSMRRLGAGEFYFFSKAYFENLRTCLRADRIHLCLVYLDGDIACAGVVTEVAGLCQYHLSATADAHFADHPSKLMLHHLRGWLKVRGNRIFHVGGGVGALRDTLHLFKAGFSPYAADFYTWRLIPRPDRYADLVARRGERAGREPVDEETFFPPYRAPLTA